MNKLCFIIPFVGLPNKICALFIRSAKWNKDVDFYIYCDKIKEWQDLCGTGENIFYRNFSLNQCKKLYEEYCNIYEKDILKILQAKQINDRELARQYFCGGKPFFQIFFNDVIKEYKYYGWIDYDIITSKNFYYDIINYLDNQPNIFNVNGKSNQSATFQIFRYNNFFNDILLNNKNEENYSLLNWLKNKKQLRYFDETMSIENNKQITYGFLTIKLNFMSKNNFRMIFLDSPRSKGYDSYFYQNYTLFMQRMIREQNLENFKNNYCEIKVDENNLFTDKNKKNIMLLLDEYSKCYEFLSWFNLEKPILFFKFGKKSKDKFEKDNATFFKKIICSHTNLNYNIVAKQ